MGVAGLLRDKFLLNQENSHLQTKTHPVTHIKNNIILSSLYNLKVTRKWMVPENTRKFPTPAVIWWFCFLLFVLSVNLHFFHKLHQQYEECLQAVTTLESMVKRLGAETEKLQEKLNNLHLNYLPSTYQTTSGAKLSFHSTAEKASDSKIKLIRSKRSSNQTHPDYKDQKTKNVVVQFSGSKPYGHSIVSPEGILGPWIESTNDFNNVEKFGAKLRDHNSTLEITRNGIYMIYVQVTYHSINGSNSYMINVIPNTDRLFSQPITMCSSFGKIIKNGEISCYTSVVKFLNAGDIIFVQQAQPNREIIFTKSYTYFGLIHLN